MKKTTVFSTLKIMHLAMLAGQVFFTAVIFYLVYSKIMIPMFVEHEKMLQVIAIAFVSAVIFIGINLFKKKLLVIKDDAQIEANKKILKYRSICLIQWALLEAGVLFCGICTLLTGNYAFLALATVIIIYFTLLTPVKNKIATQLNLSSTELDEL